jgi:non-heme chloroperoxidase
MVMTMTTRVGCALLLLTVFCGLATGQGVRPRKVIVNGVELHYVERGRGEPLILLHGGQSDYRSWAPQMDEFSRGFRVIAYSRRYNYPNDNPLTESYRSAYTDAEDLAAFIRHLKLGRVHLVGTSAGALAALVLATERPEMMRSLVLAEPPVHRWAKDDPQGEALYREFMTTIWEPAAVAFRSGDDGAAMRVLVDGFGGAGRFDRLTPEARAVATANSRFFKAATASPDPFPDLAKDKVRGLRAPILIVTGENTIRLHKFVNDELARLLPKAERVTIPGAGHGSARENPRAFNEAVLRFLGGRRQ